MIQWPFSAGLPLDLFIIVVTIQFSINSSYMTAENDLSMVLVGRITWGFQRDTWEQTPDMMVLGDLEGHAVHVPRWINPQRSMAAWPQKSHPRMED